uniref:PCNA_C domain-containing protein n=1 Tax=Panagrellus redivivus TaxID=6233 RepID=A0A7E4VI66_PANRE
MDIHNKHLDIPDQKYAATLEMSSAEFAKTCLDISQFSDSVLITATKFGVVFSGKGETGSNVVTFNGEKEEDAEGSNVITFEVNESVNSTFSIKYMLQFAKAAGISDRVRLSLSNGAPVVVEFKIDVNGYLRYYLRPFVPILNDRLEEFRLRALKEGSTEDDPEEDMINNWLASWLPPAANLSPLDTTLHSVRKVEKEIIRMKLTMGEIWTIHNELLSSLSVSINPDIVESWGIAIANFRSSSTVVEEHVNGLTEGGDGLSESLALHRMRNNQVTFVNNIVRSALFRFL